MIPREEKYSNFRGYVSSGRNRFRFRPEDGTSGVENGFGFLNFRFVPRREGMAVGHRQDPMFISGGHGPKKSLPGIVGSASGQGSVLENFRNRFLGERQKPTVIRDSFTLPPPSLPCKMSLYAYNTVMGSTVFI